MKYDLAIICVTHNASQYILRMIDSIERFAPPLQRICLVIVDNASDDNTLDLIKRHHSKFKNFELIELEKNVGFAAGNNVGFNAVSAGHYFLINQDAWLIADSTGPVLERLRADSSIAICGLPLVFPDGGPQTHAYPFSSWQKWFAQFLGLGVFGRYLARSWLASTTYSRIPIAREYMRSHSRPKIDVCAPLNSDTRVTLREVDWVCGAAMLIEGSFIETQGGFDPCFFMYGEDEDLCIRAHRSGKRVVVANGTPVVHVFGWGKNQYQPEAAEIKFQSLDYFIDKNIESGFKRWMMKRLLPFHVFGIPFKSKPRPDE